MKAITYNVNLPRQEIERLRAELAAATAREAALREALLAAEGIPRWTCNACHNTTEHAPDCPVLRALAAAAPPVGERDA